MPYRLWDGCFDNFSKEIAMKLIQASLTKRALIVGLLASDGILAASSFARTAGAANGRQECEARHAHHAHAKGEEHAAKRMSGLKEKLKLKPEQEAAWNAFAQATHPGMHHAGGIGKPCEASLKS
jgi:hypothetical protein